MSACRRDCCDPACIPVCQAYGGRITTNPAKKAEQEADELRERVKVLEGIVRKAITFGGRKYPPSVADEARKALGKDS